MLSVFFRLLCLIGLVAFGGGSAAAQTLLPGDRAMDVALVPEGQSVAAGGTVTLAFTMRPRAGWHGYWQNPGDAGSEALVEWQLPDGVSAARLRYPVPQRLTISGLMNYVFDSDYALLTEIRVPGEVPAGTILPVRAKLDYLVCTDQICVPESATVSTELQVSSEPAPAEIRATMDRYRQALPRPLGTEARFEVAGSRLRIAIPLPRDVEVEDPYFFPLSDGALIYSAPQIMSRSGDLLILETDAGAKASELSALQGVISLREGEGLQLSAQPGAVPAAGTRIAVEAETDGATIFLALAGAMLGGLLLNIMPCVFPILSLKALSLAKAGGNEAAARREVISYTAGVILVCLALGAALLALRAGGASVGWAFQLQEPKVILFLLLLVAGIALNLAGLFELPSFGKGERLARSGGAGGAFWTGALAAFVATPCTGPFMGAAMGSALVLPAAAALAVFAGLGLGLALPFLALGFIPALRRRLPKPGPWMARFRRILSVPMFLTAAGLAWILGRQTGVEGLVLGLVAALVIAAGLWRVGKRGGWVWLAPGAAAGLAAALLLPTVTAPAEARPGLLGAEPFSEARLARALADGRPVFVYFTADWCLTCKVNERGVLSRVDVAAAFAQSNVAVLVGDWTGGDPTIGRFLESHGRSGVPLYLYYRRGQPVEILPQILTPGRLTAL